MAQEAVSSRTLTRHLLINGGKKPPLFALRFLPSQTRLKCRLKLISAVPVALCSG